MVTKDELRALMEDLESDRIERTTSFREDKLGPVVCAFANDLANHKKPGYVLLGVNDKGGIEGMTISDEELQKIGNIRSNGNVLPQPYLIVSDVFKLPEGDVVIVEVHPSDYPPVRYKGRCYIRVGPRKDTASAQEERVLIEKRVSTAKTFDERICPGSSIDDLSLDAFQLTYLPQAVDAENFPDASDYRNPIIAAAMKVLGYVNRFNFGVKNAQKQLEGNGNPAAEFNLRLPTKFSVIVRINDEWNA